MPSVVRDHPFHACRVNADAAQRFENVVYFAFLPRCQVENNHRMRSVLPVHCTVTCHSAVYCLTRRTRRDGKKYRYRANRVMVDPFLSGTQRSFPVVKVQRCVGGFESDTSLARQLVGPRSTRYATYRDSMDADLSLSSRTVSKKPGAV